MFRRLIGYGATSLATLLVTPAMAAEPEGRRLYSSDIWSVYETLSGGVFRNCMLRAVYSDGKNISLLLKRSNAWSLSIGKPGGYRPGQRRLLTLIIDRVHLYESIATVDSTGIIRIELPASDRFLYELSEGKALKALSSIGMAQFDLTGTRAAVQHARRCLRSRHGTKIVSGATRSPEVAGYRRRSQATTKRAISQIQEALVWTGFYEGMIDGDMGQRTRRGIRAYQRAIGSDPSKPLTAADGERLRRLAQARKRRVGFRFIRDIRAQVAIGIPKRLVPLSHQSSRGTIFSAPDGSIKIDTMRFYPGERSMLGLFQQISQRGPIRTITYTKRPTYGDFVVSGTDNEKSYYFRALQASDGIFAFSIAYFTGRKRELEPVVVAMANFFAPLSMLRRSPGPVSAPRGSELRPTPLPGEVTRDRPSVSAGTGFILSSAGYVLTNAHVVRKCRQIRLNTVGSVPVTARVVASDHKNDLALLAANLAVTSVPKFRRVVRLGDEISTFGFPLTTILSTSGNFTRGTITATQGAGNDTGMLQISAPVQPGNSGGPLLDQSGHVVGVVVSKLNVLKVSRMTGDVAQNVNFAIKSAVVLNFLETHGVKVELALTLKPLQPADVAERAKRFTVYVRCLQ